MKSFQLLICCILVLSACSHKQTSSVTTAPPLAKSDALWRIISTQCLPQFEAEQPQNQCAEVHIQQGQERGYVIFKDQRGILQYLLMPTRKITGMESPELLEDSGPNYFYLSWVHRSAMEKLHGEAIKPEHISLAVNSQFGRSQNQLHVHISCSKVEVQKEMARQVKKIGNKWAVMPTSLLGHTYWARKISEKELSQKNAFHLMAQEIPGAQERMGEFGLG
ncbi:MAG: CDP-diacylglycerol diphosphatase, partial [Bdellovibrio sp.]